MFCPSCGSEERQATQFCRACGTDLRTVRASLERPDSITASAVSAREEIGRAVAQKIREIEDPRYLRRITERVLAANREVPRIARRKAVAPPATGNGDGFSRPRGRHTRARAYGGH
jgi:hypothetical protein